MTRLESLTLFLHIPKTAGTTLLRLVERQYRRLPEAQVVRVYSQADIEAGLGGRRPGVAIGHFRFGFHRTAGEGPFRYVAFLRDPVERVVSEYHYLRGLDDGLARRMRGLSLSEFAATPHGSNLQTKFVVGDARRVDVDPDAALDEARRNLSEHFAAVGITERFDESIVCVADALGWRAVRYVPTNIGRLRRAARAPSAEDIATIERHNRCDIELYRAMRDRLDVHLGLLGGAAARVRAQRRINRVWALGQALWPRR